MRLGRTTAAFVLAIVLTAAMPALAGERVDLFDKDGRRAGYAVVDRDAGRINLYDRDSQRTGWGRVTPSGSVEFFRPDGTRKGSVDIRPGARTGQSALPPRSAGR